MLLSTGTVAGRALLDLSATNIGRTCLFAAFAVDEIKLTLSTEGTGFLERVAAWLGDAAFRVRFLRNVSGQPAKNSAAAQ